MVRPCFAMSKLSKPLSADQAEILRTLEFFFSYYPEEALIELRTFGSRSSLSGFYDREHLPDAAAAAAKIGADVHATLNPIDPSRKQVTNKLAPAKKGDPASDKDVLCRRFIMIDFDLRHDDGGGA